MLYAKPSTRRRDAVPAVPCPTLPKFVVQHRHDRMAMQRAQCREQIALRYASGFVGLTRQAETAAYEYRRLE